MIKYNFDESITVEQAAEIKKSIFRFPNGSASYAAPKITKFDRNDIDVIYGRQVGTATVGSKIYEITVERTPGASRSVFGMSVFSIGLKEIE